MGKAAVQTGPELREMFEVATAWLEKSASDIDVLNVFPVPDGDCGTNMMLTMRSAMEGTYHIPKGSVSSVAQAMARGALMGARGNSGVILSQILRGFAESLGERESIDGAAFAGALAEGTSLAYKALTDPTEDARISFDGGFWYERPDCPYLAADVPQPTCDGCADCTCATCEDGKIELCEMSGYACAWKKGCNDDLAGMTRAAFIWKSGECYCWDTEEEAWLPTDCPAPESGCCAHVP